MDAVAVRWGLECGEAVHSCGSGLGREAVGLGLPCLGPVGGVGRRNGFALLGESLLAVAPKGTKKSCPYIRVSLRSTSLIPSLLRGSPRKGHPWPFTALAASMPLAPLRSDSNRPSERGDSVVSDRACSEAVVRARRRVGNAKLTHGFLRARFDTKRCVDCGGKCFAVFHPTEPEAERSALLLSLFQDFQTTRSRVPFRRPSVGVA